MQNFCYKCGKKVEEKSLLIENLCQNCYTELHPLVKIPPALQFKICKKCHRFYFKNRWISSHLNDLEEIINQGIREVIPHQITVYPNTQLKITTNLSDNLDSILQKNAAIIGIEANGKVDENLKPYTEKYEQVKVDIVFTICPSCLSLKRGEYKAVLHIIAPRRNITDYERDYILSLVENEAENAIKTDFLAYISKFSMKKGKISFFIGSEKFARSLASIISYNLGGNSRETYRFGSQKIPKEVKENRLYISLYLPPFIKGDLLSVKNTPLLVTDIRGKYVRCLDLMNYDTVKFPLKQLKNVEILKQSNAIHEFLIFARTNKTIQLMDLENYRIYELLYRPKYDELKIGKNIYGFDINGQIYLIL